jgi:hypothetical protein
MDTRLRYQEIIKTILQEHANYRAAIPDGYNSQVLFDDERGSYLVLDIGWNEDKYIHAHPIHINLIGDNLDSIVDTEEGVATDLLEQSFLKKILLGFRHPNVRGLRRQN